MALSQPATFNEPWSDARVLGHLNQQPPAGVDADYHVLYSAYKHMRPHDFARLLQQFVADGRNLHAVGPEGKTIHQVLAEHPRHGAPFLALLASLGA
jgi:hypothetical protein